VQPKKVNLIHKQNDVINVEDISAASGMPPKSYLNAWKKEIEEFQKSNSGQAAYIDCNLKKQTRERVYQKLYTDTTL
jgi:hypothetical protein